MAPFCRELRTDVLASDWRGLLSPQALKTTQTLKTNIFLCSQRSEKLRASKWCRFVGNFQLTCWHQIQEVCYHYEVSKLPKLEKWTFFFVLCTQGSWKLPSDVIVSETWDERRWEKRRGEEREERRICCQRDSSHQTLCWSLVGKAAHRFGA